MGGFILLFLIVIVMVFVVPAVALAKASRALRAIEELRQRLLMLEARLHRGGVPTERPEIVAQPKPEAPVIPPVSMPPPLPVTPVPPPIPETKPITPVEEVTMQTAAPPKRTIDWEQFMGAKMFAWIGGFALFLGVAFFVKYSFEHNLIPPELRVAIGFLAGIALLDIGLLAVARRKEWSSLPILGAVGTVLMQIAWVGNFFLEGKYFAGNKTLIPMAVFLGFEILFLLAALTSKRAGKLDNAISGAALGVGGFAMFWAFYFFSFAAIGTRPVLILSYLFLVDAALLGLVIAKEYFARLIAAVGIAAFIFLALWTNDYLTAHNLYIALGAYFVFALLHSSLAIAMQRLGKATPPWSAHLFPAATPLLVLLPIFKLATASFLVGPLVLRVDVIALLAAAV